MTWKTRHNFLAIFNLPSCSDYSTNKDMIRSRFSLFRKGEIGLLEIDRSCYVLTLSDLIEIMRW